MNEETKPEDDPKIGRKWIIIFLSSWLVLGLIPLGLALIGRHYFELANSDDAAIAGTIGDAFGMVNSFFSGAALMFVIWSIRLQQHEIRFARQEWQENTKSQQLQVELMRHTTRLTAINNIYTHYKEDYGKFDETGILHSVASGHRRWWNGPHGLIHVV